MNNELIAGNYEDLFVFLDLIYNRRGEVVTKDVRLLCVETCDNSALRRDHNLKTVMGACTIPVYEMLSNLLLHGGKKSIASVNATYYPPIVT